jgi:hypothetical protein
MTHLAKKSKMNYSVAFVDMLQEIMLLQQRRVHFTKTKLTFVSQLLSDTTRAFNIRTIQSGSHLLDITRLEIENVGFTTTANFLKTSPPITSLDELSRAKKLVGVSAKAAEYFEEYIKTDTIADLEDMRRQNVLDEFYEECRRDVRQAVLNLPEGYNLSMDVYGRLLVDGYSPAVGQTADGLPFRFKHSYVEYTVDGHNFVPADVTENGGGFVFRGTLSVDAKSPQFSLTVRYVYTFAEGEAADLQIEQDTVLDDEDFEPALKKAFWEKVCVDNLLLKTPTPYELLVGDDEAGV